MEKVSDVVSSFFEQYDKGFLEQLKNLGKANDLLKNLDKDAPGPGLLSRLGLGSSASASPGGKLIERLKGLINTNKGIFYGSIVFLIVVYMIWRRRNKERGKTYILAFPSNAQDEYQIAAREAPLINEGTGIASTLNMWFKVDDWNYKFNEDKYILIREGLYIFMAPQSPDLTVLIGTHDEANPNQRLVVRDVPLQKWNNVALSFDGRTVDIWLNGELKLSTVLKNLPNIRDEGQMVMCPYGGFMGQIGQLFVSRLPMRRREIIHLWRNGPRRTGRLRLHNPSLRVIKQSDDPKSK